MSLPNLYQLFIIDRGDDYTGLVDDVTTLAPEYEVFGAYKRSGTWYEIVKQTSVPSAYFRTVNAGVVPGVAGLKKEVKEMLFLESRIQMDEALWDADPGKFGGLWQIHARAAAKGAAITIGAQTWYGTSADSSGFAGARSQIAFSKFLGGTTNTTSAYLCWMDEQEGCRYDVGMDGQMAVSAPFRQQVADANDSTKSLFAYVGNLKIWIGFNVMSNLSVFQVGGIDSTHAMTDVVGSQLLAKIPRARRSNLRWFMNRTAEQLLNASRSTINPGILATGGATVAGISFQPADAGGRPAFSPLPNSCLGYPITLTDSILDTETNAGS